MMGASKVITRLLIGAMLIAGSSCTTLPLNPKQPVTHSLKPSPSGELAKVSNRAKAKHGAKRSAFHLIKSNREALKWRLALIDHATTSIDVQYFIWEKDEAGLLLLARLLDAADRGVRVRLLVDDFMLSAKSKNLAALCQHPNFKIRMFNPQYLRGGQLVSFMEVAFRFGELNQRMHNKLIVADSRLAIMGGRNIGNEYFGLSKKYNYLDLGVLVTGRVIKEISAGFDDFWNSKESYPGYAMSSSISDKEAQKSLAGIRTKLSHHSKLLRRVKLPLARSDWSSRWLALSSQWHVGTAKLVQDAPEVSLWRKGERFLDGNHRLTDRDEPKEFLAVSPYLIPDKRIFRWVERNASKGATVKMATASLLAADQPWVYAHYANHRRKLMALGAELYEFRGDATSEIRAFTDYDPIRSKKVSLHVKGGIGDGRKCYIGSLNMDPRSMKINTENGLIIDSPSLARELRKYFLMVMSEENAWRIDTEEPQGKGEMKWSSRGESTDDQPAPGMWSRLGQRFFGSLPIKSQL